MCILKLKVGLGMVPVLVEVLKEHVARDVFVLGKLKRHQHKCLLMLKDISTKFLLQDIIAHGSCFFPPEPGNKMSPCCVSERFMSGVSKVPQNKYIKSNSEILSIMGMLVPVLGAWGETPENTVAFFWMRGVFTCTCSCHFLLCSHFQQE